MLRAPSSAGRALKRGVTYVTTWDTKLSCLGEVTIDAFFADDTADRALLPLGLWLLHDTHGTPVVTIGYLGRGFTCEPDVHN